MLILSFNVKLRSMFGGGAGAIFDMINRMKENRAMLKKRDYFNKRKKELENVHPHSDIEPVSDESFNYSKARNHKARQYQKVVSVVSAILTIFFFVAILIALFIRRS